MSAAAISGNTATFTGTATDVNSSAPVVVSGYVDGKYALATTASNTGHGYSISVPVGEGSHPVCLYAINLGLGNNTRLGCQTLLIRNNPLGALESAGQVPAGVQVSGYAIDLNTTGPITVWAFLDGSYAARSVASISRPDLASRYPGAGIDHGYSMLLTPSAGSHQVCLWAINTGPGSNVRLGCRTVTVQNNPIGRLESAIQLPTGVQLTGWALDLNSLGAGHRQPDRGRPPGRLGTGRGDPTGSGRALPECRCRPRPVQHAGGAGRQPPDLRQRHQPRCRRDQQAELCQRHGAQQPVGHAGFGHPGAGRPATARLGAGPQRRGAGQRLPLCRRPLPGPLHRVGDPPRPARALPDGRRRPRLRADRPGRTRPAHGVRLRDQHRSRCQHAADAAGSRT